MRLLQQLTWRVWPVAAVFATGTGGVLSAQSSPPPLLGTEQSDSVTLRESGDTVTLLIWRPAGVVDTAQFRVRSDSVWRVRPRPSFLPPPVAGLLPMYIEEKRASIKLRKHPSREPSHSID